MFFFPCPFFSFLSLLWRVSTFNDFIDEASKNLSERLLPKDLTLLSPSSSTPLLLMFSHLLEMLSVGFLMIPSVLTSKLFWYYAIIWLYWSVSYSISTKLYFLIASSSCSETSSCSGFLAKITLSVFYLISVLNGYFLGVCCLWFNVCSC